MAKRKSGSLGKYWGYLLFVVVITGWLTQSVGPAGLLALSGLTTVFFLFRVPVWCGALTREEKFCRKNANGILMGCSLQHHKWQKLKFAVVPPKWRELNQGLWVAPEKRVATTAAFCGMISAVIATIDLIFK